MLHASLKDGEVLVVLIAMHAGLRRNEIRTLTWPNVDLTRRTITISSVNTKNKAEKVVPMSDTVYQMLKRKKEERDKPVDDLVFVSRYNQPLVSWRGAFASACKKAKLTDLHLHDLRHCFASWLAMKGVGQKALMSLLGHRSPKMTLLYSHISDQYRREAVQGLPSFDLSASAEKPFENPFEEENDNVVAFAK